MEKKFKLGVIGGGYMAYSIISGAINGKAIGANEVLFAILTKTTLINLMQLTLKQL